MLVLTPGNMIDFNIRGNGNFSRASFSPCSWMLIICFADAGVDKLRAPRVGGVGNGDKGGDFGGFFAKGAEWGIAVPTLGEGGRGSLCNSLICGEETIWGDIVEAEWDACVTIGDDLLIGPDLYDGIICLTWDNGIVFEWLVFSCLPEWLKLLPIFGTLLDW